jgi:hypothetical protein
VPHSSCGGGKLRSRGASILTTSATDTVAVTCWTPSKCVHSMVSVLSNFDTIIFLLPIFSFTMSPGCKIYGHKQLAFLQLAELDQELQRQRLRDEIRILLPHRVPDLVQSGVVFGHAKSAMSGSVRSGGRLENTLTVWDQERPAAVFRALP